MTDNSYQLISRLPLLLFALAMIALPITIGCGTPKEPMGLLTGSVASKGKVCGDCRIAIYNPTSLRTIGATVNESGTFRLEDIPFGEYQVMVLQKPNNEEEETLDRRIPKKYRSTDSSGLKVSIETPEEVVLEIEM